MSTWLFWVVPVQDVIRPADGPRERACIAMIEETHFMDKGQRKLQRQLQQLKAHTCADKPLWVTFLFIQVRLPTRVTKPWGSLPLICGSTMEEEWMHAPNRLLFRRRP
jgi:hypothetical protein